MKPKKKKNKDSNKAEKKLDLIISLLKDLLVLELRGRRRTRDEIRKIVRMDTSRVSVLIKEPKAKKRRKKHNKK